MSSSDNFSYIIRLVKVRSEFIAWHISSRLVTFVAFELDKGYEDDWSDDSPYAHYANVEPIVNGDGTRTRYEVRMVIPTDVDVPSISNIGIQLVSYKIDANGKQSDAYRMACKEAHKTASQWLRSGGNISDQRVKYAPIDGVEIHRYTSMQTYKYGETKQDFDVDLFSHFLSAVTGKNCMVDILKCFHNFDAYDDANDKMDVPPDTHVSNGNEMPNVSDDSDDASQLTQDADISVKLDELISEQQLTNMLLKGIYDLLHDRWIDE